MAFVIDKDSMGAQNMLDKIAIGQIVKSTERTSLAPKQRLHLTLLGVEDVAEAAAFYAALGWKQTVTSHSGFAKIDLGGYALCLLPRSDHRLIVD